LKENDYKTMDGNLIQQIEENEEEDVLFQPYMQMSSLLYNRSEGRTDSKN
jgi:hypothetical protein